MNDKATERRKKGRRVSDEVMKKEERRLGNADRSYQQT